MGFIASMRQSQRASNTYRQKSHNEFVPISSSVVPAVVRAAGERVLWRFLEFFATNIRRPHTRRAYYRAAGKSLAWCASAGMQPIAAVQPVHVASWISRHMRTCVVGFIVYSIARVGAALGMTVGDVYTPHAGCMVLFVVRIEQLCSGMMCAYQMITP
jgi:hypothetical protein